VVGVTGFEPATSTSQKPESKATPSRHSPLTDSGHANAVTQPYKVHRESFLATWEQFSDSGMVGPGTSMDETVLGWCPASKCRRMAAGLGGYQAIGRRGVSLR
jgi:hypothetical protein